MDLDTRMEISSQVKSRQIDDEIVILDLASGEYFGLDGVGRRIWELIAEGKKLGEAAAVIAAEYEVDAAQGRVDVIEFVGGLVEKGLLVESRG